MSNVETECGTRIGADTMHCACRRRNVGRTTLGAGVLALLTLLASGAGQGSAQQVDADAKTGTQNRPSQAGQAGPAESPSGAGINRERPRAKVVLPDSSDASRALDLSGLKMKLLYEADFSRPLKFVKEESLFDGERRVRVPEGVDWVLEGQASAEVRGGRLHLNNDTTHLVFWNTRSFPDSFLLDFDVSPAESKLGLNIVFFAAKGCDGGSIFDLAQPKRDGLFKTYHTGGLNCYHTSYWAVNPEGQQRGTAHFRKNRGFHLVAAGKDFIAGQGPGPHRVRLLKRGPRLELEVNGKIASQWTDDGQTYGPVLHEGLIGLRQMSHTKQCSYGSFRVWSVE